MSSKRAAIRPPLGFTLIEVLVVVAIIALLISILLPSLKLAKEQSRATVCLSNLKQQGTALSTYSADNARRLPWAGSFRFSLMEGLYYILDSKSPEVHNWGRVNLGLLFPKYVGNTTLLYYCPGNRFIDAAGDNGTKRFLHCLASPKRGDPGYINSHTFPDSPFSAYAYAVPAAPGASPRDDGPKTYSPEVVKVGPFNRQLWPYWDYLNGSRDTDPNFLGGSPPQTRGRHNVPALVSDGFFRRDYYGYHFKGHNVLYTDYHARRVNDPKGQIYNADLSAVRGSQNYNKAQLKDFQVWDFFSKHN